MSDAARAMYFLAGLVAIFVLAWFVGAAVGPSLDNGPATPRPEQTQHGDMS